MSRTPKEWIGATDDTPVPPRVRLRVLIRFDRICQECTTPITGKRWVCDHRIAIINGGPNREANLGPSTRLATRPRPPPTSLRSRPSTTRQQLTPASTFAPDPGCSRAAFRAASLSSQRPARSSENPTNSIPQPQPQGMPAVTITPNTPNFSTGAVAPPLMPRHGSSVRKFAAAKPTTRSRANKSAVDVLVNALPFHTKRTKDNTPWWNVKPTGDYSKDLETGKGYARYFLPLMAYNLGPVALGWIVCDMAEAGRKGTEPASTGRCIDAIALGFMLEIGGALQSTMGSVAAAACAIRSSADPTEMGTQFVALVDSGNAFKSLDRTTLLHDPNENIFGADPLRARATAAKDAKAKETLKALAGDIEKNVREYAAARVKWAGATAGSKAYRELNNQMCAIGDTIDRLEGKLTKLPASGSTTALRAWTLISFRNYTPAMHEEWTMGDGNSGRMVLFWSTLEATGLAKFARDFEAQTKAAVQAREAKQAGKSKRGR
jgi:hypothetical protein